MVGDMAYGMAQEKTIAYQISKQKPAFLVALGDIVYPSGRLNQYMSHFFSTYNDVANPSAKTGAPLMANIPLYPLLGNHDVSAKLRPCPTRWQPIMSFARPRAARAKGRGLLSWARIQVWQPSFGPLLPIVIPIWTLIPSTTAPLTLSS